MEKIQEPKSQTDEQKATGLAQHLGSYAYQHHDYLNSPQGKIIWRNAVKSLVALLPTAIAFTGNRYLFSALRNEAKLGKFLPGQIKTMLTTPFMGQGIENTAFVLAGFSVYRSFVKFWQRAYDRVTGAGSEADAIAEVAHIPANIATDAKDIIPHELSSTMLAAPVLALGRLALNPAAKWPLDHNPAWGKSGYLQDMLAATVAYTGFCEVNDRAYANISGGKDLPDKIYSPFKKPEDYEQHKKYGFFTNDGAARILFRRGGAVLMGFAPYIALQRFSRVHAGEVKPFEHGVLGNIGKEYSNYCSFSVYSVASELYGKAYDALFERLEAKDKSTHQK